MNRALKCDIGAFGAVWFVLVLYGGILLFRCVGGWVFHVAGTSCASGVTLDPTPERLRRRENSPRGLACLPAEKRVPASP